MDFLILIGSIAGLWLIGYVIRGATSVITTGIPMAVKSDNYDNNVEKRKEKHALIREQRKNGTYVRERVEEISPSEMRKKRRKNNVESIVHQIIEDGYEQIGQEYEQQLKPLTRDLDFQIEDLLEGFTEEVRKCCIQIALTKDPEMGRYLEKAKKDLCMEKVKYGNMEGVYLMLYSAYVDGIVSYDARKAVARIDKDAMVYLKKCFLEAIKVGCGELEQLEERMWLIRYWHSWFCLENGNNKEEIELLCYNGYKMDVDAEKEIKDREALYERMQSYKAGWQNYLNGIHAKELVEMSVAEREKLECSLEKLLDEIEPWLLDDKLYRNKFKLFKMDREEM